MKTFKQFREGVQVEEEYTNTHFLGGNKVVKVKSTGATGEVVGRHRQDDGDIHFTVSHGGGKTSKHPGSNLKVHKEEVSVQESPVDGVAKGSLPDDQHMCATKIFKEGIGEGTPILGEHALPDEDGHVSWYKVMFENSIEIVEVTDETVKVLEEGAHGNHKKKK